ncbi:MAG: DHH family phosphoesterase [Candidatus Helarchaeota archaeon]
MKTIVILSHKEDLDGIGSTAIIKRYFDQKDEYFYYYYYSNYDEYIDLLAKGLTKKFSQFYILDIGFNDSLLNFLNGRHRFFRNVDYNEIKLKIKKIIWIDHHHISAENKKIINNYFREFIHEINNVCTATILYKYLSERFKWKDNISERISELAYFIDHNIKEDLSNKLQRVVYGGQENLWDLYKLTDYLSKGEFENDWINKKYKNRLTIEKKEFEKIEKNLLWYKIDGITILAAYSDILTPGQLVKYLYNEYTADIYLAINKQTVSIRSHSIRVNNIATEFEGGGHEFRAGFIYRNVIKDGKLSTEFLEDLKQALKKNKVIK